MTNEFTIEGSPDKHWETTYYNQRRDRLADIVGDYLNDESTTASQFYDDMISEVEGWVSYYKKFYEKSSALKLKIMREKDKVVTDSLTGIQFIQE
jgi:hypothetical protein